MPQNNRQQNMIMRSTLLVRTCAHCCRPWFLVMMISAAFVDGFSVSPNFLPEEVVQAQLKALQQSDIDCSYKFFSPAAQEDFGQPEDFGQLLSLTPFDPILGHVKADVLLTTTSTSSSTSDIIFDDDEDTCCCLVRIVPKDKYRKKRRIPCLEYWWELSLQEENGPFDGCWMIESIMPDFEDIELTDLDLVDMLADGDENDDIEDFFY
mmetsp:Transcript_13115/g.18569  ORF Transcript_13115/g.18569 Transcript_13115/m.18569 type:complete len:208 (+) Transcript_13115:295-918(+)